MKIVRVYSGNDGESHLEDLTLDQLGELVNKVGEGDFNLTRRPRDLLPRHPGPRFKPGQA